MDERIGIWIPLSGKRGAGKAVLIDREDYPEVSVHTWRLVGSGGYYVAATISRKTTLLHRLLVNAGPSEKIDHRNRDRLDCRKLNLRRCTAFQNNCNKTGRGSWPKGVHLVDPCRLNKWRAVIKIGGGKRIHLGVFPTIESAANAYNEAAIKYHGEFACLNQ